MRLNNLQTKKNYITLSNELDKERIPEHVAIIMDGNGRWATKKGLPRSCLLYTSPSPRDR